MAKKKSVIPRPAPQLKKLKFLIGNWHTRGEILPAKDIPPVKIMGMDSYEWISGGFFILHRADVMMGSERTEVIEIIGYDESRKSYFMRSFDSHGETPLMYAEVLKPGVLSITDKKIRSVLTAQKNGRSMAAKWEISENGKIWKPWMNIYLQK